MSRRKFPRSKLSGRLRSPTRQKILLLLLAGIGIALNYSPKRQGYVIRQAAREWKEIDKKYLLKTVHELKRMRWVELKEYQNGKINVQLTKVGRENTRKCYISCIKITRPKNWDKKWRIVFFDIPEFRRSDRDELRAKLKDLGFVEMQKSVFIYPYPCQNELNVLVEYWNVRSCVRLVECQHLPDDSPFRLHFSLN